MCGRFTLATPPEILEALFETGSLEDWNEPRFNIAPQVRIVTVRRRSGRREGQSLLWGARNPRASRPLINARSETAATSPLFAPAFSASRILIPADGFFEWTKEGLRLQGRYFQQPGGRPFAFAGLAVHPSAAAGSEEPGAVILTGNASESVQAYHHRMPVIIRSECFDAWLDPDTPHPSVLELMESSSATGWASHPVGPSVNNVRNDGPDCIRFPAPTPERQGRLF